VNISFGADMKLTKDCYECLQRLIYQAVDMATEDENDRKRASEEGLKTLEEHFTYDQVSIVVATKLHDAVKFWTGNPDPYSEMKRKEKALAREIYHEIKSDYADNFHDLVRLAVLGNTLDFFRPLDVIKTEMRQNIRFAIDDTSDLEAKINSARKILYLADNAGEMFFDLPLVKWMRRYSSVDYVVKASPVQNDITPNDIYTAGLEAEFENMITTGTATPGIDFSLASAEFKREFESADLVFAKGMGYYESLSELPDQGRFFHCLVAKCQPVADSLKVPLNSYVALLR
jgi:uncharacterized protein with ATP-grasp and redox domains